MSLSDVYLKAVRNKLGSLQHCSQQPGHSITVTLNSFHKPHNNPPSNKTTPQSSGINWYQTEWSRPTPTEGPLQRSMKRLLWEWFGRIHHSGWAEDWILTAVIFRLTANLSSPPPNTTI